MKAERFVHEAASLYRLPPDEFVDRRTQRAKELRESGDRDVARQVARLRKPTLSAWAIDQVAHRQPGDLHDLFATGDALRQAYENGDGGQDGIRTTTATMREKVADLREAAVGYLVDMGATVESHVEDIEQTLTAAAIDPRLREDLQDGVLARTVSSVGFQAIADLQLSATGDGDGTNGAGGRDERLRRAEQRRLEQRVSRLQRRATEARKRADRLRAEADQAEEVAQEREADLRHAENELTQLRITL